MLSETNRELGDFHDFTHFSDALIYAHSLSQSLTTLFTEGMLGMNICVWQFTRRRPLNRWQVEFISENYHTKHAIAYASEHLKAFCCFYKLLIQLNQYLNSTSHGVACFAIMAIANVRAKRGTWLFCTSSPTRVFWMPICDCSAMPRS